MRQEIDLNKPLDMEERKRLEKKIRRYGYYQVILLTVLVTGVVFMLKFSIF